MRKLCHKTLKIYFCACLTRARRTRGHTQSKMAELLAMDDRSYADLEHGKSCCSAVTLGLYLAYACDDPVEFVKGLRQAIEMNNHDVA